LSLSPFLLPVLNTNSLSGRKHALPVEIAVKKTFPGLLRGLLQYSEYSKNLAMSCLQGQSEKDTSSIFQLLLHETKAENRGPACVPELISESSLLLLASRAFDWRHIFITNCLGYDTTGTAPSNTIFHLLNNLPTYIRLCSEIRSTFSNDEEI
jgi:hypothetical protein